MASRAAETARNLRRLGVFRKVSVDSVRSDSGLTMLVQTKDGWSTQADVRFRSTGGQTDWQVMMAERNLLGTASRFAVRYRHTPDRSLLNFNFLNPRLIAHQVSLGLNYQHRSDGDRFIAAVERPFYSLEDRRGISTLFDFRNERVLQYFDGVPTAGDSLRRRYVLAGVEAAKAIQRSTAGYIRVGLNGQVRRDDYSTWPQDTSYAGVTGTLGTFVEYRRANFAITRGFRSFGQDEDIDLSNFVRFGVYAAPELFGYDKGGVGALLMARFGTQLPFGFAWLDARVNGVQTSAGLDSGSEATSRPPSIGSISWTTCSRCWHWARPASWIMVGPGMPAPPSETGPTSAWVSGWHPRVPRTPTPREWTWPTGLTTGDSSPAGYSYLPRAWCSPPRHGAEAAEQAPHGFAAKGVGYRHDSSRLRCARQTRVQAQNQSHSHARAPGASGGVRALHSGGAHLGLLLGVSGRDPHEVFQEGLHV